MKKIQWLITYQTKETYPGCNPSIESDVIELSKNQTPIDWYLSNPKIKGFITDTSVSALINFWKIDK